MATTAFSDLVPEVVVHAPGCSEPLAEHYIRLAAIDLCKRSAIWEETLVTVDVDATDFPYTLTPTDAETRIDRVKEVFFDGLRMTPWSQVEAKDTLTDWRDLEGTPSVYLVNVRNELELVPFATDVTGALDVTMSVVPTWDATGMDSYILERYRDGLVAGAVARLCAIPGQMFTNTEFADHYGGLFRAAVSLATLDANKGNTFANSRVMFNNFR